MNLKGNTILITGGGSGIGRGLAEAFHAHGNQVVIAGRRKPVLDEVTAANRGMKSLTLDIEDADAIRTFAAKVVKDFPKLNVLVNNAGIMRVENVRAKPDAVADAEATVATNLLGTIRMTGALLAHLQKQPHAAVMNVSSGLAFVPIAATPTYCATKAAVHSYSQSLRHQLRDSSVEVLELIPPYVQTELLSAGQAKDPRAMPLSEFIAEVMEILKAQPKVGEIVVKRCEMLRYAAESKRFDDLFQSLNAMSLEH
jgi:uncharacterized oxidoreductase